jgi:hypothetical protein
MADKEKAKPEGADTVEEPTPRLDVTVPGGCYVMGDRVVDANGIPKEGWTVKNGVAVGPGTTPAKKGKDAPSDAPPASPPNGS